MRAALELALDDDRERRALHTADGQELEPRRPVASETKRVSVAPQIRSMSWRASPARASGSESSTRLVNASSISSLVRAE